MNVPKPPKSKVPKTDPKPELVYEYEGAPPKVFVIRHKPSRTWWRPDKAGYTTHLLAAGTYPEAEARKIETIRGDDEAVPLEEAVRTEYDGAKLNPMVVAAIAARVR